MTDAELNAAVAVEVMGWEWVSKGLGHFLTPDNRKIFRSATCIQHGGIEGNETWHDGWSPATDIADAFEVVGRMRGLSLLTAMCARLAENLDVVHAGKYCRGPSDFAVDLGLIFESLTPRAICEAALAAVAASK